MSIVWKLQMILGRALIILAFLTSCGDESTLTAQFTATQAPQLIVVVSMDKAGNTNEDINLNVGGARVSFGGTPDALKACGKYLGWIDPAADSGSIGAALGACSGTDSAKSLSAYFASILAEGLTPPAETYSPTGLKIVNKSEGYVFLLSFYDLDKTVGNRCVQLAGAEIRDGNFFILSTGQVATNLSFDVQNIAYPALLDTPATDRSKCFKF